MAKSSCVRRWGSRVALGASAGVLLAPLGYRVGVLPLGVAFLLLAVGFLALALSGVAVLVSVVRARGLGGSRVTGAALVVSALVAAVPLWAIVSARGAPPIHDIATDTVDPPKFVAAVPHNVSGRTDYEGEAIAAQQRAAYPDIQPVTLADAPDEAFRRALAAVRRMGWELTATDVDGHRIEATDTTFWFGFTDDIVIRIRVADDASGSRLDVRSLSRVGLGDAGANARRIRGYLLALRED